MACPLPRAAINSARWRLIVGHAVSTAVSRRRQHLTDYGCRSAARAVTRHVPRTLTIRRQPLAAPHAALHRGRVAPPQRLVSGANHGSWRPLLSMQRVMSASNRLRPSSVALTSSKFSRGGFVHEDWTGIICTSSGLTNSTESVRWNSDSDERLKSSRQLRSRFSERGR